MERERKARVGVLPHPLIDSSGTHNAKKLSPDFMWVVWTQLPEPSLSAFQSLH